MPRSIERWIERYKGWGVNLIPLKARDKAPIVAWKEYQTRKATESEVKQWEARGIKNFGAVCGRISGNLIVIDVDREDLFSKLNLEELAGGTFTVKTGKGYHIYLRTKEGEERECLKWNEREEIRFQGEGTYVVGAGSVHPTGKRYEQYLKSPLKIAEASSSLFEEIEKRWKKFHELDKIEEKEEITKWKTKRSSGLEDFKGQVSLKEIVRHYVSEIDDYSSYFKCCCPLHEERNPSFAGYKETNTFYCFGCDRWGDVITLVKEIEGEDFLGAIRKIEEIAGIKYFEGEEEKAKKRPRLIRPADVEEMILDGHKFATLKDTGEVIYYKDGCWRFNGEAVVRELIERILTDLGQKEIVTNYFRNEVIGHLKSETYIERERLNADRSKVNLMNGVYDIETYKLLPHDPNYYFTYELPVNYKKGAECKRIKKFLSEVLHKEDIEVVLEFIGYCLIQETIFHKALMFLGEGANGKSTFIELIRRFLGKDNTTSHSLQSLVESRFLAADLYGRLANMSADISHDAMKRTGLFKKLTGRDTLSAEKKFMSPFSFVNSAKLIFSANRLPPTFDDTDAFFRRWILIDFPNVFEGRRRDVRILETLTTEKELSGFFNLVISKLSELLKRGRFSQEKSTEDIREEYTARSNPTYIFVEECLEEARNTYETKDKVYSQYIQFCRGRKLSPVDKTVFGKHLPRYIRTQSSQRRDKQHGRVYCWTDIRLKEQEEKEVECSCGACGVGFKSQKDLTEHQKWCGEFQRCQAREVRERSEGDELWR